MRNRVILARLNRREEPLASWGTSSLIEPHQYRVHSPRRINSLRNYRSWPRSTTHQVRRIYPRIDTQKSMVDDDRPGGKAPICLFHARRRPEGDGGREWPERMRKRPAFPSWRQCGKERRREKKRTRREAGWGCKARWWYAAPMAWHGVGTYTRNWQHTLSRGHAMNSPTNRRNKGEVGAFMGRIEGSVDH